MSFVNEDGTPHSAILIPGDGPIPNMAGEPAIPRAYTRNTSEGLAQGQTDTIRFTAEPAAEYRVLCGVPGHGQSGMWIRLAVSPDAPRPSLKASAPD